jgi:hypothetical protein
MDEIFSRMSVAQVRGSVFRNIKSVRVSQDLWDDLAAEGLSSRDVGALAQKLDALVKPAFYTSSIPIIDRPFEEAIWFEAVAYPFRHLQASRFSDGSFGVWYGSSSVETTVHETAYHWFVDFLRDAQFEREDVIGERKVYEVGLSAALLDVRALADQVPALVGTKDYSACQSIGAQIHREGHPGLLTRSARHRRGENVAIFNPVVLADPRLSCQLTYRLQDRRIHVQRSGTSTWMTLSTVRW